jgi:ABC-type multidrug transport system fused ATPase/permease subunit
VAHPERIPRKAAPVEAPKTPKKAFTAGAWEEARALIWKHRKRMALGLGLMIINRLSGLVLPTTTKYLMDDVITRGHWELLPTLAFAAGAATLVDAGASFANSQVLGVAAQRAITEMRKDVEAHVMRLPIQYFDSTKTGVLISRIMNDADGIRNLVGTGLVQLTGSILTALIGGVGHPAVTFDLVSDQRHRILLEVWLVLRANAFRRIYASLRWPETLRKQHWRRARNALRAWCHLSPAAKRKQIYQI